MNLEKVAVDEIVKLREACVQLQPDVSKPFAHQDKFLKQMTTIFLLWRDRLFISAKTAYETAKERL